jgi:hypothetical protein
MTPVEHTSEEIEGKAQTRWHWGIYVEAGNRAAIVENTVCGYNNSGTFPFHGNQLPEHVFASGIVHVDSEVTWAEAML